MTDQILHTSNLLFRSVNNTNGLKQRVDQNSRFPGWNETHFANNKAVPYSCDTKRENKVEEIEDAAD